MMSTRRNLGPTWSVFPTVWISRRLHGMHPCGFHARPWSVPPFRQRLPKQTDWVACLTLLCVA